MEGYTNDRTAASDALRNGYVNAILPPTPAAGAAVAAVPVVGVGASATAETSTVSFAMHERQELYSYMAGTLGQADDAPSGYMALSSSAFGDAKPVPLGDSNDATDPEWVQKTKWNRSYQAILDQPDSAERWAQLAALAHDFVAAATHYASIIVMECHLPPGLRTIQPSSRMGGTAGGVKYEAGGLLLKFARGCAVVCDMRLQMRSPVQQGQSGYYWADVAGLCFPLMAVIDFMGYRVLAMTLLPITKQTLIYGSDSGGRVANAIDSRLNALMETAGTRMNLAPHYVGSNQARIFGPGDIEGHLGLDGKFYVLDYGRTYPPEAPQPGGLAGRIFFELLRPELVRSFKLPLCSDAFTGFLKFDSNRQLYADHVRQATNQLVYKVIPDFADFIGSIGYEIELSGRRADLSDLTHRFNLIVELHRAGINVRHLGRLRACSTCSLVRRLLLSECLYRVIKNALRTAMRDTLAALPLPRTSPFQALLVEMYNRVAGNDAAFWESYLPSVVALKFQRVMEGSDISAAKYEKQQFTPSAGAPVLLLRAQADPVYILGRLNHCFGGLSLNKIREVVKSPEMEFMSSDFGAYMPSVKHLGLVHFAAGRALGLRGMRDKLVTLMHNPSEVSRRLRLLAEARDALSAVLLTAPDSAATLLMLARIELFPVVYYQTNGDLSFMERALVKAMGYLDLVRKYGKREWEPAALMAEAALRSLTFVSRREMQQRFEDSLRDALALNEASLDALLYDVLREPTGKARSLVLDQVARGAKPTVYMYLCNQCRKTIQAVKQRVVVRHVCEVCEEYDLCGECYEIRKTFHDMNHKFRPITGRDHAAQVRALQLHMRDVLGAEAAERSVLGKRLRIVSRGLETLSVADVALPSYVLLVLDLTALRQLDVSGCRRLRSLPTNMPLLEHLNISYCKELQRDAVRLPLPNLRVLIARGGLGDFEESVEFVSALPLLERIDWMQRVFSRPFFVWSASLQTLMCSHVKHVGGYIVAPRLRHAEFHGSELVTSVVCDSQPMARDAFDALRRAVDCKFEMPNAAADATAAYAGHPTFLPESVAGSPLARFLRRNSSSLAAMPPVRPEAPKTSHELHIHSASIASLNLHACTNIKVVHCEGPELLVLNLFRVPHWTRKMMYMPRLATLYISEWAAAASEIAGLIGALAPSLKHFYLCEAVHLNNNHLQLLWQSQPKLVLANFYCSPELRVTERVVHVEHAALRDVSFEGWASVSALTLKGCARLERLIVRDCFASASDGAAIVAQIQGSCASLKSLFVSPAFLRSAGANLLAMSAQAGCAVMDHDPVQLWGLPSAVESGAESYVIPPQDARAKLRSSAPLSVPARE